MIVVAVVVSLALGGVAGFFLGVASTKAGKAFMRGMVQEEEKSAVSDPRKLIRKQFELQYPSNWHVDVDDKDYDPDHMFSIDSPGHAFVMFVIGAGETEPEDSLKIQLKQFDKIMSGLSVEHFERYGRHGGRGATLKGRIMGSRTTVKLFALSQDGLTVMITQQCPEEDLNQVQDGLDLIESSFLLRTNTNNVIPNLQGEANGRQPFRSETNRASNAEASRHSP
jgi:hypothetical protein